jgi:hypothetical protein
VTPRGGREPDREGQECKQRNADDKDTHWPDICGAACFVMAQMQRA